MGRSGGPTVGLDIGSRWIKVAEVVPSRGGVTVRAIGMAPTPEGSMENNVIVDPQLLGDAVKKLLKESGCSSKSSVSSVSGQGALVVRVIEVPKMSDNELAETMRWEVERHVPFAANEVIMDFQVIDRADAPPDAQNMEVLLAVAQQDMIDRHVEMLKAAGLKPSAIDVEPLAAARSLIELSPDPYGHKTIAVINIGASNTDIGIFRDGVLSFPRTLPLAGDAMTRAIMPQMGLAEEQAEEMKVRHGEVILDQMATPQAPAAITDDAFLDFSVGGPDEGAASPFGFHVDSDPAPVTGPTGAEPESSSVAVAAAATQHDPSTVQVFNALAPTLGEMLTEIRRSIEYYRGRSADGHIDQILLCGGTAKLRGLDTFLTSELGISTQVADPFAYAPVSAKSFSREYLQENAPSFAVAVGLGARDLISGPAPAPAPKRSKKK